MMGLRPETLLAQAAGADADRRRFLEDLYVDMAVTSLRGLVTHPPQPDR